MKPVLKNELLIICFYYKEYFWYKEIDIYV
jgi:hypothetical protein